MAFSGSQITRLGLAGIPRGLYGSFAGKAAAVILSAEAREIILVSEDRELSLHGQPREIILISPSREVD